MRAILFALLFACACGPSGKPGVTPVPAASVTASNVTAPVGVSLVMACTPTGPELCFNAIDDNCNGVIDEGCGVYTGLLQFTAAWGDSPADIDLVMHGPNKEHVSDTSRTTPSGFKLDHDCPNDGCMNQNIENIYFEGQEPPRGHYTVDVKLADLRGAETPVKVRFGARVGSRTFGADLAFTQTSEKKTFAFDL